MSISVIHIYYYIIINNQSSKFLLKFASIKIAFFNIAIVNDIIFKYKICAKFDVCTYIHMYNIQYFYSLNCNWTNASPLDNQKIYTIKIIIF